MPELYLGEVDTAEAKKKSVESEEARLDRRNEMDKAERNATVALAGAAQEESMDGKMC